MNFFSRRQFLSASPALLSPSLLQAANKGALNSSQTWAGRAYPFSLGVASGSPRPDGFVLWTRILPEVLEAASSGPAAIAVRWEVALDEGFRQIVAKGRADALPQLAHSVHVEVMGMQPDRWYWYRFMLGDAQSPVGRTRTAPRSDAQVARLKLAVASCQHWEFGSYAAHQHIANANPDLVAFLGDYIYEWGPYALQHPTTARRNEESFTLADYRRRYAQYKSDPQLQAAHLAAPWIMTWDDHEVANDYAQLQDERLDKNFAARRAAAYQAFYEHMPMRLQDGLRFSSMRIFDALDWGQLARLYLLDNRQYRAANACLPAGHGGSTSVTNSCRERLNTNRSLLGKQQEQWLNQSFASSGAQWNIVLQQTLMAQNSQVPALQAGTGRFWTDGWDGYPASRQRLLQAMQDTRLANPLVMSGDVHTFYASNLVPDFYAPVSSKNPLVATEFCGTSISSSSRPQARTERYLQDNPHTKFGRSDQRGFMLFEIDRKQTLANFQVLDDVKRADAKLSNLARFVVPHGKPGVQRA